MDIRIVDSAQYEARVNDFDYDMISERLAQSDSPGNEQREFWGSAAAGTRGSRNHAGVSDSVVDRLIEGLVDARDRETLVAYTHALDRVLLWGYYMVPHWFTPDVWLASWNRFGRPAVTPPYAIHFSTTWWIDPAKNEIGRASCRAREWPYV